MKVGLKGEAGARRHWADCFCENVWSLSSLSAVFSPHLGHTLPLDETRCLI